MNTPAIFEAGSRPTFRERVAALSGVSGWREPAAGHTTRPKPIPGAHLTVGDLAMARRDPDDIGPDIAFDALTGRMGHARKVCLWLGRELGRDRSAAAQRCREHIGLIAVLAYRYEVLREPFPPTPEGVRADDWGSMLILAALCLEYAAEDALALAERRAREVA
jgi:hypothetical protein